MRDEELYENQQEIKQRKEYSMKIKDWIYVTKLFNLKTAWKMHRLGLNSSDISDGCSAKYLAEAMSEYQSEHSQFR